MIDLNATQAAIRAGYSELTADVQDPRLLGNVGCRRPRSQASSVIALLRRLGSIDAIEANALAMNFDRVAVND
ncbi:terminase small subunit [Mesorhizobium sp. M0518]